MNKTSCFSLSFLLVSALGCTDTSPPRWGGDAELTVEAVSPTSVRLNWPAATDDREVRGFRLLRDDHAFEETTSSQTDLLVEGLDERTEYRFTVIARDEAQNPSEPLHATITTADGTPPSWPAGSKLEIAHTEVEGRHQLTLTWNAAEDPGGITQYRVKRGNAIVASTATSDNREYVITTDDPSAMFGIEALDDSGNWSRALHTRFDGEALAAVFSDDGQGPVEAVLPPVPAAVELQVNPAQIRSIIKRSPAGLNSRLRVNPLTVPVQQAQ